jgi:DNA-binding XRE family transcriptional regulator
MKTKGNYFYNKALDQYFDQCFVIIKRRLTDRSDRNRLITMEDQIMTLKEWMDKKRYTLRDIAEAIGVTKQAIFFYKSRRSNPSLPVANRIIELSDGEITAAELERCDDERCDDE